MQTQEQSENMCAEQSENMCAQEAAARSTFEQRPLTERQIEIVNVIKKNAENLLRSFDQISFSHESDRLTALARNSLEESVMWATKAVSRESRQ